MEVKKEIVREDSEAEKQEQKAIGIKYMLIAVGFFSMMKVCVKLLDSIPSYEIVVFRSLISLIICYVLLKKLAISPWGNNKLLLILRGVFGTIALLSYFYTLQNIPLATAVSLQKLSPIFTIILAVFLLKEKIRSQHLFFILISFSGVLVLRGFDTGIPLIFILLGVISALFSGLAYNMVRKLKDHDHHLVIVFYFPLVTLPIIGPYTIYNWVQPVGYEWLLLLLVGVFTQMAQVNMTKAYQVAKVSDISVYSYLDTVFALLIGYLLFGEMIGIMGLIGISLIVGGAFLSSRCKY